MQPKSIHNPAPTENAQHNPTFPTSGDNFITVTSLDGVTDPMSWLTAIDFVNDCAAALAEFEEELQQQRTGTPETP